MCACGPAGQQKKQKKQKLKSIRQKPKTWTQAQAPQLQRPRTLRSCGLGAHRWRLLQAAVGRWPCAGVSDGGAAHHPSSQPFSGSAVLLLLDKLDGEKDG